MNIPFGHTMTSEELKAFQSNIFFWSMQINKECHGIFGFGQIVGVVITGPTPTIKIEVEDSNGSRLTVEESQIKEVWSEYEMDQTGESRETNSTYVFTLRQVITRSIA